MVQRREEDDLGRRFSRVEQVKLERRRREKIEPQFIISHDAVVGHDPVKRVLFEPDQNLQGWIDGELGKMAEFHRSEWNFDFKRGVPANIPGHNWEWELPQGGPQPQPQEQQQQQAQRGPQPLPQRGPPQRAGKPLAPWAARRMPSHPSRAYKVPRSAVSTSGTSQKKITDFMAARKYPNVPGSGLAKAKASTADQSSDEDENDPTLTAQL